MAQKKITDLEIRSDFDATCNLPADDTSQTWRVTGAQIAAYIASLNVNPTVQRFLTGSGTYTRPSNVKWIKVRCAGGGGGGAGTGATATNGGAGGDTTFGTSLLTAAGGAGALTPSNGDSTAAGGTATVASPGVKLIEQHGGDGSSGDVVNLTSGEPGGVNALGGGGGGGIATVAAGTDGKTNTGAGGGGGGGNTSVTGGSSGAAGAYLEAHIISPSSTYAYAVGAGGTAGGAGTAGFAGGAGGSGIIIVEEHYQ